MFKKLKDGIIDNNPVFSLFLGLCSSLAVSNTVDGAIGMSVSVIIVLLLSNILVSLMRKITPDEIRIPVYIVIIASFTKALDMLMAAYAPVLHETLGVFLSLIAVNCIILGRAESFASKNSVKDSIVDAITMGLGYSVALIAIAVVREGLGTGGFVLNNPFTHTEILRLSLGEVGTKLYAINLFRTSAGAFLTFASFAALFAYLKDRKNIKRKEVSK